MQTVNLTEQGNWNKNTTALRRSFANMEIEIYMLAKMWSKMHLFICLWRKQSIKAETRNA